MTTVHVSDSQPDLELVDPNPDLLDGYAVSSSMERLSSGGRLVEGAAADGVTRVLLRSFVSGSGSVTFEISSGDSSGFGEVTRIDGSGVGRSVTVQSQLIANRWIAAAIYRSPDDFNLARTHAADSHYIVTAKATYTPTGGIATTPASHPFYIVRPPLLFVHGLWSSSDTWKLSLNQDKSSLWSPGGTSMIRLADYRDTNAAHFDRNKFVVDLEAYTLLFDVKRDGRLPGGKSGIAATQVDVVAHSMGGILTRLWESQSSYRRPNTFGAGTVHKLITFDTPHYGSQLASVIQDFKQNHSTKYGALAAFMRGVKNKPIDEGAIEDLAVGSAALNALPASTLPAHAFVGKPDTGDSGPCSEYVGDLKGMTGAASVFGTFKNDGLVAEESEIGGLLGSASSVPADDAEGCHTSNTGSDKYSKTALALLNESVRDPDFGNFPAPKSSMSLPALPRQIDEVRSATVERRLTITSPSAGQVVTPGSRITITVESSSLVSQVLVGGPGFEANSVSGPTFKADVTLPSALNGPFDVNAFGLSASGDAYDAAPVTLFARPAASVQSISAIPSTITFSSLGQSTHIRIRALYDDGITRDTTPVLGVTFESSTPEVASVSADGVITPLSEGDATIGVHLGPQTTYVRVVVELPPPHHRPASH